MLGIVPSLLDTLSLILTKILQAGHTHFIDEETKTREVKLGSRSHSEVGA